MTTGVDSDPAEVLRARLRNHPPDRHPLQHATAQFHLGAVLLDRGALDQAEEAFTTAAALFDARGARPEHAKALNGLGATLRADGRLDLAARALEHAAAGLRAAGLSLDEGAAQFNLGLVLGDSGDRDRAAEAFARAAHLLDPAAVPAQAAAAMRELGAAHLAAGRTSQAEAALENAVALADRARDEAARAAAANTLGLARLAAGEPARAVDALATAVATSPRNARPEAFAMAKANLALAYEQTAATAHARLAARQALAVPAAPDAVRTQAAQVLARLGAVDVDLRIALEDLPNDEARARLVREELARAAELGASERVDAMGEWIDAHVASSLEPADVAELWLGGLLELPPDALEALVASAIEAAADVGIEARETFREGVSRAMARFHIPQWMRLQDVFSQAAGAAGDPGPWK